MSRALYPPSASLQMWPWEARGTPGLSLPQASEEATYPTITDCPWPAALGPRAGTELVSSRKQTW